MEDTEGIDALVDRAEVLLSLAGEPTERVEMLLAAQTSVLLALVKALKPPSPKAKYPPLNLTGTPAIAISIANSYGIPVAKIAEVMIAVERDQDWATRKIHSIKEVRNILGLGLKEAKDLIDHACDNLPNKWWL